jgi:hypothetical protein
VIVIASGAFITSEFQVEFGKLPPALLPLGNLRLYQHQAKVLQSAFAGSDIFLSITDAYELRGHDARLLRELGIGVISVPDGLTLGESLLFVVNSIGRYNEPLRLLHGDTLIRDLPSGDDVIALAEVEDAYAWEVESSHQSGDKIWCGYFSFADVKLLARSLCAQRGKFVDAVRDYRRSRPQDLVEVQEWLDLGHVNTYFRSRARFTTARSFNELAIQEGVVRKSSTQQLKMQAEANWFASIPSALKRYTPQLIRPIENRGGEFSYELEYLAQLPLNELYVHGSLSLTFWKRVFRLVEKLLSEFQAGVRIDEQQADSIDEDFRDLVYKKTDARLFDYLKNCALAINDRPSFNGLLLPSIKQITEECQAATMKLAPQYGVSHGDLCFSNILYDSRLSALKVLDPRGFNARNEMVILGDLKYDIAKVTHSIVGLYDHIVAGLYELKITESLNFEFQIFLDETTRAVQKEYLDSVRPLGIAAADVQPLVVLLFLSMLPLHSDNPSRQAAFFANALRLYIDWKRVVR